MVIALLKEPWYHGPLPTELAEKRVNESTLKSVFLVRYSVARTGFVITFKRGSDAKVEHQPMEGTPFLKLFHDNNQFLVLEDIFDKVNKFAYDNRVLPVSYGRDYDNLFRDLEAIMCGYRLQAPSAVPDTQPQYIGRLNLATTWSPN